MSDNLRKFVNDHRDEFDNEQPDDRVWNAIRRELPSRSRPNGQWIWKAAAIVFFLSTSVLLWQHSQPQPVQQATATSKDFAQVEDFYFKVISEKKALITDVQEQKIRNPHSAELELQRLDAMYLVLKQEMKKNPSKQVVDALTLNLLIRVDLLNKVLADLDANTSDEPDAIHI